MFSPVIRKGMLGYLLSAFTGITMGFTETLPVQESWNSRDAAVQRDTYKTMAVAGAGLLIIFIIEK